MPRVFIIPHHQDERLFSGTAALANDSQSDFNFHVLPPDTHADSPLTCPISDFREVLSHLCRRKGSLNAAQDDLLVAFYQGLLQAREAGLSNLFLAGARYDEPTPCTAVVSLKFLSWEILEDKFNYDLQRHALLHLLVCSILGAYTHVEAHRLDMRTLAVELVSLRREMRQTATEPDQDIAIGQIAAAEAAARKGDASSVLRHLKSAGKWAFELATKIGVSVAAEAIKKSMGL